MSQEAKNVLNPLRSAHEEEYFQKKNTEALARIAEQKERERLSPVAKVPMVQETIMGVVVDRCPQSGGIWLDKGELEQILHNAMGTQDEDSQSNFFSKFIAALTRFEK